MDGLLKEWRVRASLPPQFRDRVWRRIALAETAAPANRWGEWRRNLQSFLSRPSLATGYVTALLVVGFGVGWFQGVQKSARVERALSTRYVQVIDPYRTQPH